MRRRKDAKKFPLCVGSFPDRSLANTSPRNYNVHRRTPQQEQTMRVPVKLSSIEQEHLQELYDAAGVARDELPYTEKFDELWLGFQNRTFKDAEREQVFG